MKMKLIKFIKIIPWGLIIAILLIGGCFTALYIAEAVPTHEYKYKLIYQNGETEIIVVDFAHSDWDNCDDCFSSSKRKPNSKKFYQVKRSGVRRRILISKTKINETRNKK
jgi:hypothetical protein